MTGSTSRIIMLTETLLAAQARAAAQSATVAVSPSPSELQDVSDGPHVERVLVPEPVVVPEPAQDDTHLSVPHPRVAPRPKSKSKSRSRPDSRPRASPNQSVSSVQYFPGGPEDLLLPDGVVSEDMAELLHEIVHPHRHEEETMVIEEEGLLGGEGGDDGDDENGEGEGDEEEDHLVWLKNLPWWRRPSPWW